MLKLIRILLVLLMAVCLTCTACDDRKPTSSDNPGDGGDDSGDDDQITYNFDGYAFRDLTRHTDIVQMTIYRNNAPYSSAIAKVNNNGVAHQGNGIYAGSDYGMLNEGSNRFDISIEEDDYETVLFFEIPDSFSVISIERHNPGGYDRYIQWSECQQAGYFYLAVHGKNSEEHLVEQYQVAVDNLQYFWNIPNQTWRNANLILVPDIYYVSIVAVTRGLTTIPGAGFTVPQNLTGVGFPGITGNFSAGLLAPKDSIIVTH
ncbi:MAG: hypothetical protein GY855_13980 [candidate division Zixibacteria bacterium]|nr:hypothetical protein [candidate division Zixibacteria bacterium]